MKDENIEKDEPQNIYGVSCRSRYKETSKLIKGYDQHFPMSRALGFEHPSDGQSAIHKYRSLINFSDVETVCEWLFENGYDIVKKKKKRK